MTHVSSKTDTFLVVRFVDRADNDIMAITAGLWLKPAVMLKTSLPACGSTQQ
jgi:hypothetical protein